jgi:hypothetical protein
MAKFKPMLSEDRITARLLHLEKTLATRTMRTVEEIRELADECSSDHGFYPPFYTDERNSSIRSDIEVHDIAGYEEWLIKALNRT